MHSNTDGPVAALAAAASAVLEFDFTRLCDDELVSAMRTVETVARQLATVSNQLVVDTVERSIPQRAGYNSTPSYLQDVLRLSRRDATARFTAAKLLGTWHDVSGHAIPVDLPATTTAQRTGDISAEHARKIASVMHRVRLGCRGSSARMPNASSPPAPAPAPRKTSTKPANDSSPTSTPTEHSPTTATANDAAESESAHNAPTSCHPSAAKSTPPSARSWSRYSPSTPGLGDDDTRTAAQRNHDALTTICDIAVRSDENGTHRGLPVTPIITMTIDQLEDAAGVATTATGGRVPVSDALKMAEKCRPWLAIFDHVGRPLHLGRSKRLASLDQRIALIAFDRGCTRPGCTTPPTLCAVHHPKEWINGGATDIDNETIACDPCHALITGTGTGWQTIKAGPHHRNPGRTMWIPPKHIDPQQKPRINHAHHPEELLDNAIAASDDDS